MRDGTIGHFRGAFAVTALGLAFSAWLGWAGHGGIEGAARFLLIGAVLAVLEVSLSFDNAIVNARILARMPPVWQHRFLTWGILIAVFGMRIIFPLLIVAVAAHLGPFEAVRLAIAEPHHYAEILEGAHLSIAAFGGAFLMMVGLGYFVDAGKEVDWIDRIECRLRSCAATKGLEAAIALAIILLFAAALPDNREATFIMAAVAGLLTHVAVDRIGSWFDSAAAAKGIARAGGLGAFLYLEVLDASFSFDGVIGAFALTQHLFLIAAGLGIGAMYVRSMTVMLVERGTLAQFRFLEHGAFYSILALSGVMFLQTLVEVPEVVTALVSAGLIGLSLRASLRWNRLHTDE